MSRTGINWTSEFPRFVADVTGDGRADLVGCGINGVWVSRNDGQGNFQPPECGLTNLGYGQSWRVEKHVRTFGQFGGAQRSAVLSNQVGSLEQVHMGAQAGTAQPGQVAAAGGSLEQVHIAARVETAAPGQVAARAGALESAQVTAPVQSPGPIHTVGGLFSRPAGADIAGFGDAGVWVALSEGDGTFDPAAFVLGDMGVNQGWQVDRHLRLLADLNHDGLSDIVGFGDAGVWTALCTGQPAAHSASIGPAKFVLANFGYNQGWRVDQHPRMLADLTGNGPADILGFGNDGLWTALGHGDGSFADAKFVINDFGYNQGWRTDVHERLTGDLNGDGKADFIGFGNDGVWTALSNGVGGFAAAKLVLAGFCANQGWKTSLHPRFVTDLTGNHHADIIGFGDDGVWTALGNGDGTFDAAKYVLANFGVNQGWTVANHPRFLADVNGDGLPDIVGFGNAGVWVALNKGDGTFGEARFVLADFGFESGQTPIKHIFVLMMENRSFDHFLGFSKINGTDAKTGQPTTAECLTGRESNAYTPSGGTTIRATVATNAPDTARSDINHQFSDVLVQLCGQQYLNSEANGQHYPNGQPYPTATNTGFVADYIVNRDPKSADAGDPMQCFAANHPPILNQLAREFVLCDHWFSAMAGPTEPNRMFVHAATSGVWDDSPSNTYYAETYGGKSTGVIDTVGAVLGGLVGLGIAEIINAADDSGRDIGISFDDGTLFDAMRRAKIPFRIYTGDGYPQVGLLKGISITDDLDDFSDFAADLKDPHYDAAYTFIEPRYDTISQNAGLSFVNNSQHPANSVALGEQLIKSVYEAIRNSPHWNESMLILTWDEHGGIYDHVPPPRAVPTGKKGQAHGFMFDQYGPRVPAVVISPLCPKNMIHHDQLEHSVVPATVEQVFGLSPMTVRDGSLVGLQSLATLQTPRTDAPTTLSDTAPSNPSMPVSTPPDMSAPLDPRDPWLVTTLAIATKAHIEAAPADIANIKSRVFGIKTVGDIAQYVKDATPVVENARTLGRRKRVAARAAVQLTRVGTAIT